MGIEYDASNETEGSEVPYNPTPEQVEQGQIVQSASKGLVDKAAEGGAYSSAITGEYASAQDASLDAKSYKDEAEAAKTAAETAQAAAETAESNAATSESNAATSASDAATSASNASTSATNAETAETNAATSESNAATSETNAATSETNAATSETNAAASATTASTKASEASTSATNAATSESNAATSASTATTKASEASTSASNAASSATTATTKATEAAASATSASTSATTATTKASEASTSATNAATSESNASASETAAATSETNAATSETNAATSETNAATSETNASASATSASASATTATTKASEASTSATNAATSETNAATSETNAATSASTATTKASEASTSATNAATSESNAATSETNAATSESNAATSESNAATSETNASNSEADAGKYATHAEDSQFTLSDGTTTGYSALHYNAKAQDAKTAAESAKADAETAETNAATSATNAATSETNAATSATSASNSATTATTKASEASTSATSAENAKTAAETAKTAAETAKTAAETALDSFDDRYLGSKSSAPTVDNDGDALVTGALYWDTTQDSLYVWNGSSWSQGAFDSSSALLPANNLSDLSNVTTARDNLDLGSSDDVTFGQVNTDYVDLKSSGSHPSHQEGRIFYDNTHDTLAVYNSESDITLQVGQEEYLRVYNSTGSTIANGTPVYITGSSNEVPTIAPASANSETMAEAIGLATHSIENNTHGFVTVRGLVGDLDTSSFSVGDRVHVSPTTGTLQVDAPTYPYFPVDVGICLVSHASNGCVYVDVQSHNFEELRITNNARVDNDLVVGGDLTVLGTQTIASSNNVSIGSAWNYFNSGDTIGESNTTFTGSGLDDGVLTGHFEGTAAKSYYVEIDGTGTPDTFKWSYNSDLSSPEATAVAITGSDQELGEGISIKFNATTGHTSGDKWSGSASPVNVDSGIASNRNTGTTGVGYTHMGLFFDVSDQKWKFFDEYDPEPEGAINTGHASFSAGTVVADTFEGDLTGDVTGNADTATQLETARTITLTGDVTGSASFDGSANVSITATVGDDSHNHTIANVDGLQSALDGKVDDSQVLTDVPAGAVFTDTVYTHPTHPGDDFSVDTGALTGATVVSDIDINVTTDSLGHVTDANGSVSTRTLTLADLGYTGDSSANNYAHPTFNGDDFSIDTGALSGATVISDLDINITSNSQGHVTDANASVATRDLTLADLGYTGATDANNYVHPSHPGDDISIDTGALTGATVISDLDFNVTTDSLGHVTDANATIATRNLTAANVGAVGTTGSQTMSGTLTAPQYRATGSSLLQKHTTTWTTSPTHDIIRNDWNSGLSDYLTLKAAGNSAGPHGVLVVGDYAVYFGQTNNETGAVAGTDSTNPLTTTYGYVNSTAFYHGSDRVFDDGYHPNADKWTTARTLSLTGDVTGSVSWDGSANASITTTVANDSHTHDTRYLRKDGTNQAADANQFLRVGRSSSSGYCEMRLDNNADNYLIMGSIGTTYSGADWAGSSYIYADRDLRIKSSSDIEFFAGGHTLANRTMILDSNYNLSMGEAGKGSSVGGRYVSLEGGTDTGGEGSGRLFFSEHNSTTASMDKYGMSIGYRGGPTTITGASGNNWTGLSQIANGEWGMWGHNNDATGSLIMHGDRAGTYVDFSGNNIQGITDAYIADQIIHTGDTDTYMQFHNNNEWRVVTGGTEMLEVNDTNIKMSANLDMEGNIIQDFTRVEATQTSTRNKLNLYGNANDYAIGMQSGVTYGHLNDWAMTFQFNNETDRGFWWGHSGHTTAQGAMSLTTNGKLYVDTSVQAPDMQIENAIYHDGDTDTYMQFHNNNEWRVVTGGTEMLEVNDTNVKVSAPMEVINDTGLYVKTTTNGAGAAIQFSDNSSYSQVGKIEYKHSDGAVGSEPVTSNDGFIISGSEPNTLVNIQGYLNVTQNANIDGNLEADGNLQAGGDIYVADQIIHTGDTDTYMQFNAANQWRVVTGGGERLRVNSSGIDVTGNVTHDGLTMTSGTDIDQLYTLTTTALTLTTSWQDVGISGSTLATGTYIVQVYVDNHDVGGGQYNEFYSGVMTWYGGSTNDTSWDEIPLHSAGHADNDRAIYLRTLRRNSSTMTLQIATDGSTTGDPSDNYVFKFRRMI